MAQELKRWTLNYENKVRILCCGIEPRASLFVLHCSSSLSFTNGYLAVDSGGCLYTNNFRALIAGLQRAWMSPREDQMCSVKHVYQ